MITFKYRLFFIQLLILLVSEINSKRIFFRGRFFDDDFEKLALRDGTKVQDKWHIQKLDHFNSTDTRTWSQRYHVNEDYYGKLNNNPIFLMLGGEDPILDIFMTAGFWIDRAQEHNALLLHLEHRFYGESHPTKDTSIENLQYLTVEQALEDTVQFIRSMKKAYKLQETNKWILFGGSYAGNLVAWLRLKYSDLIHGGVSSSSPVQSVVDYKDFFRVVAESLATYSPSCVTTITEAFSNIDQLSQDVNGKQILTNKFNLCDPLEKSNNFENDFAQLNNALATKISIVVQDNKVNFPTNHTIDSICQILENKQLGSTSLERFAALNKILLNSKNRACLEYNYQDFISYCRTTNWNHGANKGSIRQWLFQTCNQLGFFGSSTNKPQVFGNKFPVDHMIQQCRDVFGPQYTKKFIEQQIEHTNNVYGGKDIVNKVDNVVFVHGSLDPWHALGVTSSSNPKSPAIYITGTGHCADVVGSTTQELPQLTKAKADISSHIRSWL